MFDHLRGRPPSPNYRRMQVLFIISFWISRVLYGGSQGPRVLYIRTFNRYLKKYSPWQVIVGAFTALYALMHWDILFGLSAPEPLARLYSPSYYRAAWIASSFDAGFATGMSIRFKWLRDICSVFFSVYYLLHPSKSEEKLRKFRAVCTTEMLRATWNKTTNPYLRLLTFWDRPRLRTVQQFTLSRPSNPRPVPVLLFFSGTDAELKNSRELIIDFPGGGFVSMGPHHHEERLRRWAKQTGKPVLALDYSKAPEYPFPYAIEEGFDVYCLLTRTKGTVIGMSGISLDIVMSGDSAGANICVNVMFKILQAPPSDNIPPPVALIFNYPAFDFGFSSWMSANHLRILQAEHRKSSTQIAGLAEQKNHYAHKSPLSAVDDRDTKSGKDTSYFTRRSGSTKSQRGEDEKRSHGPHRRRSVLFREKMGKPSGDQELDEENFADTEESAGDEKTADQQVPLEVQNLAQRRRKPFQTHLSMTSRVGYFQDQIISPSMMRAMAILYVGPDRNPDFETDYQLSPILAPYDLLSRFPQVLIMCGEKDPFVDDSVIFAGRLREAKRARRDAIRRQRNTTSVPFHMSPMPSQAEATARKVNSEESLLHQTEDDWVQLEIIEGWSHGYLQMTAIMPEAKDAIEHLAQWIEDVFAGQWEIKEAPTPGREGDATSASETEIEEPLTIVTKNRRASSSKDRSESGIRGSPRATGTGKAALYESPIPLRPAQIEAISSSGQTPVGRMASPRMVSVKEGELMKRRRLDAVIGMEETGQPEH